MTSQHSIHLYNILAAGTNKREIKCERDTSFVFNSERDYKNLIFSLVVGHLSMGSVKSVKVTIQILINPVELLKLKFKLKKAWFLSFLHLRCE